jgi:hypothetical protein
MLAAGMALICSLSHYGSTSRGMARPYEYLYSDIWLPSHYRLRHLEKLFAPVKLIPCHLLANRIVLFGALMFVFNFCSKAIWGVTSTPCSWLCRILALRRRLMESMRHTLSRSATSSSQACGC